jgi:hypothetical protein
MSLFKVCIADHVIGFSTESEMAAQYIMKHFRPLLLEASDPCTPDLYVMIEEGYGVPFVDYEVEILSGPETVVYVRKDYRIEADPTYYKALIEVFDEFALKHALLNLYSAFLTSREWGLVIHSSCLVQGGEAYLFAGHSGAGKSTVARLSRPRPILSDEATIIRLDAQGVLVYNSPFRSDTDMPSLTEPYRLQAVHLLHQASYNKRFPLAKMDAVLKLLQRVFYWAHDPKETKKLMTMCKTLVERVPVYELSFQKNDTFWEEIS